MTAAVPAVDVKSLHAKIGELTLENDFLERCAHQGGIAERKAMIDREHDLSITKQAEVLQISVAASITCRARCLTPISRSCGVSIGCIWSFLSPVRGC
ncbi:hypothetical protein [Bradyrhizobium sp. 30]|uniref:hypothetical protein n=1 Tax=Bradyrhizobium sp. 30 TaxID=2782669 RepID=UPI003211A407